MPTYDYQCRRCGFIAEVVHSMFEDGPTSCGRCGGELRRVFHPTGIIFKGGGFYKTDSRSSSEGVAGSSNGSSAGSGDGSAAATSSAATGSGDKGTPKSSGAGAGKGESGSGSGSG